MDQFEKQQNIQAIKAVVKARSFFIVLVVVQVILKKVFAPSLSLPSNLAVLVLPIVAFIIQIFFWLYIIRPTDKISQRGLQIMKAAQIVTDLLLVTIIIYTGGTIGNNSVMFYMIVILGGSILYRVKGTIFMALSASILFTTLALLEYHNLFIIRPNPAAINAITVAGNWDKTVVAIIVFNVFCLATAIWAGYLESLFSKREGMLKKQRDEADALRLEAEEARLAQEMEKNKVAAVIKNLTAGLIMLDQTDKIVLVNNLAEQILNVKRSKLIYQNINEVEWPSVVKLNKLINLEKSRRVYRKEIQFNDPGEIVVEVSTANVLDTSSNILGKMIVLNDITREKAIEKMKSEFLTITAHQLRTPLSEVKWAFSLVMDQEIGPLTKEQKRILQGGYECNERMIVLINDLLNATKIEEGRFTYSIAEIPFVEIVKKVIDNFQNLIKIKHINIKLKIADRLNDRIKADRDKIKLVVENLLENALNYSPDNSTVAIAIDNGKNNIRFTIKDEGIGIPKKEYDRLFTKFFRGANAVKTDTEGNGLGLYLSKNIIEGHGGEIWFDSEMNAGSTFYFSLPVVNKIS